MSPLASASVRRVAAVLDAAGMGDRLMALAETARTAEDAARACGVPVGAIVKSLLFEVEGAPVMALVAGDRRCDLAALPAALGMAGTARRCDAAMVRSVTGFAIGGVAPLAHPVPVPIAIDASLARFDTLYAAAGHPHCVFRTTLAELEALTRGTLSDRIGVA